MVVEETVKLTAKPPVPPPANDPSGSAIGNKPARSREEGELSSSDEDDLPLQDVGPTSKASVHESYSIPAAPVEAKAHRAKSGKRLYVKPPSGSTDIPSHLPAPSSRIKGTFKNQVPFKSSNLVWTPGMNNDLVISFSDDDGSGSDGDQQRRVKAPKSNSIPLIVNNNRIPPGLPPPKVNRKSSRTAVAISTEQRPHSKISNSVKRYTARQQQDCSRSVVMNSSELQDLRQQIAIRENELKLKRVQVKGNLLDPLRDDNTANEDDTASRKIRARSVDKQFRPEEPERKRLKVAHSNSGPEPTPLCGEKLSLISVPPVECRASGKSAIEAGTTDSHGCHDGQTPQMEALACVGLQIDGAAGHNLSAPISQPRDALIMSTSNASLPNSAVHNLQPASVSPDSTGPFFFSRSPTIIGSGDMDLQSLLEIEELNDKELEEAQELRRRREIEERNAFKTYREAQRALAEANAHCLFLYRKRESYAAELRTFLMEGGSSLLWSRQHGQIEGEWNTLANSETKATSSHRIQAESDAVNQLDYDSNNHRLECGALNRFPRNMDGQNFGSEACSEPDVSTSDLPHKNYGTGILSSPNDLNLSADEDEETFQVENVPGQANAECVRKENKFEIGQKDVDCDSVANIPANKLQDSLLLEAELRSKLFSQIGKIASSRRNAEYDGAATVGRTVEDHMTNGVTEMIREEASFPPEAERSRSPVYESVHSLGPATQTDVEDDNGSTRARLDVQNNSVCSSEKRQIAVLAGSVSNPEDSGPSNVCKFKSPDTSASFMRSVFYPLQPEHPVGSSDMIVVDQHKFDGFPDDRLSIESNKNQLSIRGENCIAEVVRNGITGGIDSYTSGSAIHPFWPLCMYELRGKCNDEECPWQHSKDYSNTGINHQNGSGKADCKVALSNCLKQRCTKVLTPPTYLITLDTLGADLPFSGSADCRKLGPRGRNIFATSLILSSSLHRWLHSDEPIMHGGDSCVETRGFFDRKNSYFRSKYSNVGLSSNSFTDNERSLEMALHILNQEVNKAEGTKKLLSLLSRALEADPTSSGLWIVYLHFFYGDKHSVGEDDMFPCAAEHNEGSYELWLMYINSRKQLNDRFSAYERALASLCLCSPSCTDDVHASACLLDLFLQMLNCLSLSGNTEKAIQRICGLFRAKGDTDMSCSLPFSDILPCLTVSDKCIFWVSCLYLVIYRKLPDKVVQQFEYEKEMPLIDWHSVVIGTEDKEELGKIIEMAVDSTELVDCEPLENTAAHKSCCLFAVNIVKLVSMIDGAESCRNLLDKYTKLYPSCIELLLLSARTQTSESEDATFLGFEEALQNWLSEAGLHCIWNQYAQFAIENGKPDKAREIMNRWFTSVWKLHKSQGAAPGNEVGDAKNALPDPALVGSDAMFGLLNLSLYRLLSNNLQEASQAADKALTVAGGPEDFRHCVREHAMFWLKYGSQLGKGASTNHFMGLLKSYLNQAHKFLNTSPLTRKFIRDIKKPSLRQLVDALFSPASPDFSVVNLVLETWFGPSMLPQKLGKLKDFVDFVESILDVSPSNYPLALSVCNLLTGDSGAFDSRSAGALFWASSLLVNAIYQAVPLAPEYVWVEAANLLRKLTSIQEICDSFHRRAVSTYPFSIKLWRSFFENSVGTNTRKYVVESARERGMELESSVE